MRLADKFGEILHEVENDETIRLIEICENNRGFLIKPRLLIKSDSQFFSGAAAALRGSDDAVSYVLTPPEKEIVSIAYSLLFNNLFIQS